MFRHIWKWAFIIFFVYAVVGCSNDSADTERVSLPFDSIEADVDLHIPPGTEGKPSGDGAWPPSIVFDPPVHPLGEVRWLRIEKKDVPLESTELKDGMLKTKEFGDLELVMLGPSRLELHATRAQISKIEDWLTKD